jgi:hypothetical protein
LTKIIQTILLILLIIDDAKNDQYK